MIILLLSEYRIMSLVLLSAGLRNKMDVQRGSEVRVRSWGVAVLDAEMTHIRSLSFSPIRSLFLRLSRAKERSRKGSFPDRKVVLVA
ncbi:hypothetical protein CDAR_548541 [Caerostris darwini]|uniref:Secreted protein n=1 Tax=Caerostris darwini TaxID=1538125 RepID=A0AAV4WJI2_9ARAC|nr:hypothetical protein CDAR_548541 [Caerostris darwini]